MRPTASISTTIGVACATLLVMGGILAGPAILDCSADTGGFGSCLRDQLADSGLLAPDAERLEQPALPVAPELAVSEEPSLPAEPVKPMGWIEAQATEPAREPAAALILTAPTGEMSALTIEPTLIVPVPLALAPGQGALDARGATGSTPPLAGTAEPKPTTGEVTVTGSIGSETTAWAADLIGRPPPAFDEPLVEATVEVPVQAAAAPEQPPPPAVTAPPPQVVRFDPQYPNVLVLPAPAEGEDSSFRTLQLN